VWRLLLAVFSIFWIVGCEKLNETAIVLHKEHIGAAAPRATPGGTAGPEQATSDEEQTSPPPDDEIAVDAYWMKREDRGTSRDPRAMEHEQWLVKVRTVESGRTFNVSADLAQFKKLKEGDRVQVKYHVGKYTRTIWASEIVEK
jgi:hypothetical protein